MEVLMKLGRPGFILSLLVEICVIAGIVIYGTFYHDNYSNEGGLVQTIQSAGIIPLEVSQEILDKEETDDKKGGTYAVVPSFRTSTYRVRNGDNLWNIARRNNLDFYTLLSVNHLEKANKLSIGQKVKIPNQRGILRTLQKGETIEDMALMYDVSIRKIIRVNRILDPYSIEPGTELFIPGAKVTLAQGREILKQSGIPAEFCWPVNRCRITSRYGYRRDPFTRRRAFHSGVDLAPGYGARVSAAMNGIVTFAGWMGGYGKLVVIRHAGGYSTRYGHLSRISSRIRKGRSVSQGQQIGNVGNTGRSTGAHLHFEIRKNGRTLNPLNHIN
ncbi:peptidoglycan DD-metalloendopeptidase family protein [Candidatus Poribacteria bacterium]|nr:peptidoglycan DD-metalloendopeptidase family protein [Candidatus Poribacteria bacterium]